MSDDGERFTLKTPCRWCGKEVKNQGHSSHEQWCDENPHRGTPTHVLREMGKLDASGTVGESAADDDADPDQEPSADGGLPPRTSAPTSDKTTLDSPAKEGATVQPATPDGGEQAACGPCPICGSEDTGPAGEAKRKLLGEREDPEPTMVALFDAAGAYCNKGHLFGGGHPEPVDLEDLYA